LSRVPGKRARPVLKGPGHGDVPRLPDIWGVLAGLEAAGLITLADKGHQGSTYAKIPSSGMVRRDPCDAVAFPLRQAHWSRDR
jgi:hypothetical protein